ncbi:MAG: aminotransferase class I/II-fold pyridoxal phosphate-dependent enzyme [Gemmatimonadetes bacterium]|nr:aminotransferase class I/II-fold pyridoxal phosphate-dependent enzyme [Gemmatimonadota bacterium]
MNNPTDIYPRSDFETLGRYLPDRSPIAADLSDNRNLWGAHPAALAVLAAAGSAEASQYPGSYADRLADAVAARLGISPANVTTGAGGTGVLDALMRAVAPTSMRFLDPGWPAVGMLARMSGHEPVSVDWEEGLEDPVRFAGSSPGIVFVANPGNPTGQSIPDDWIQAVYEHTEATGSVLIIDEAYGEYNRAAGDRTPFDMALKGERTLCVKTLSKAYGLAGLRAGYGVGSPSLVLEVDKARGPFVVSSVTSAAAAAALASDSPWLADTVAETRTNRDRLRECLRHRGYPVPASAANFVFILQPDEKLEPTARRLELCGVRVRPFRGSTAPGSGLRATIAPWDKMQRLLDGLDLVAAGKA